MNTRIVTDSACDLPAEVVSQYGITVIPLSINVGETTYMDGVNITRAEFYTRLPGFNPHPKTSAPGPDSFTQTYQRLADEGAEGGQLLNMPWGIVSLVDLYTGFTLFSLWIFYREKSIFAAILWTIAMMTLGFFTGALYVFLNLMSSNGDWKKFFLGKNA